MVASNYVLEYQEHLADRILGRLCEAAELVSSNLTANRNRLRELLDDLAVQLDAGDLAMEALEIEHNHKPLARSQMRLVHGAAHKR